MNQTSSAPTPKITLPGYRIQRLLGRGGMAEVYLAIQESFGREVAIKILSPTQSEGEDFSERFLREARIVSRLSHPHIVSVYDVGIHEGYHYLSMEYVEGPNLKEAYPELSLVDKIRVIKEVAKALDFAGKKGYVHRDVKPENIMLRDSDGHAVLTDFGIARGDELTHGMTQTGKAIGTPHYMSPEQTKGLPVDPRSDVYSLGVVLFLMITGYVPYDADSAVAVGIKHLTAPIPTLPPGMKIFQPIINTCLSKSPEHRYQTGGELLAALNGISEQQLQAMDGMAAKNKTKQADYNAATMAATAISDTDLARTAYTSGAQVAPTQVYSAAESGSGRYPTPPRKKRSGFAGKLLLLLILASIGYGGYLARDELNRIWVTLGLPSFQDIRRTLSGNAGDKPVEPVAVAPAATPVAPPASDTSETAGSASAATADPVAYIHTLLETDPRNAIQLAQQYRARIQDPQASDQVVQQLKIMRDWFADELRLAFEKYDTARARELVDIMRSSFPRIYDNPKFKLLENQLARYESVDVHLRRAESYLEQNRLIEPPGNNALQEYRAALAIQPDHALALQGIKKITDSFHNLAIQHQSRRELKEALAMVDNGLRATADDPELLELQKKLQDEITIQQQVQTLLSRGDLAFQQGYLLEPTNKSAFNFYSKALKLDKDSQAAQDGLTRIQQQKLLEVQFVIRDKKFTPAESMLLELEKWFGKTQGIDNARKSLQQAVQDTLPQINRFVFSDAKLLSLNVSRPKVVKPIRTLFFGFEYKNLPVATGKVEAYLLDSTGQVAFAHKVLSLDSSQGEHFFDMLLPVSDMKNGRYVFDLILDGKSLYQTSIFIDLQS